MLTRRRSPLTVLATLVAVFSLLGGASAGVGKALGGPECCAGNETVEGLVSFESGHFHLTVTGQPGGVGFVRVTYRELHGTAAGTYVVPVSFDAAGTWRMSVSLADLALYPEFDLTLTHLGPDALDEEEEVGTSEASSGPAGIDWQLRMVRTAFGEAGAPTAPGGWQFSVPVCNGAQSAIVSGADILTPESVDAPSTFTRFASGPTGTLEGALPVN